MAAALWRTSARHASVRLHVCIGRVLQTIRESIRLDLLQQLKLCSTFD